MPFDPSLPQPNTLADANQMRARLTALNADIQTRTTPADVNTLGQSANGSYDPSQMQQVPDKIDELINALRR